MTLVKTMRMLSKELRFREMKQDFIRYFTKALRDSDTIKRLFVRIVLPRLINIKELQDSRDGAKAAVSQLFPENETLKHNFCTSTFLYAYMETCWVSACAAGSIHEKLLQD